MEETRAEISRFRDGNEGEFRDVLLFEFSLFAKDVHDADSSRAELLFDYVAE